MTYFTLALALVGIVAFIASRVIQARDARAYREYLEHRCKTIEQIELLLCKDTDYSILRVGRHIKEDGSIGITLHRYNNEVLNQLLGCLEAAPNNTLWKISKYPAPDSKSICFDLKEV